MNEISHLFRVTSVFDNVSRNIFSCCIFDSSSHICLNDFTTENFSSYHSLAQIKKLSIEKVKRLQVNLLYWAQNSVWLLAVGAMKYQHFPISESSGKCCCKILDVYYSMSAFLEKSELTTYIYNNIFKATESCHINPPLYTVFHKTVPFAWLCSCTLPLCFIIQRDSDSQPFASHVLLIILSKSCNPSTAKTKLPPHEMHFHSYIHFDITLIINGKSYFWDLSFHSADRWSPTN
jgi:hypothetical protein